MVSSRLEILGQDYPIVIDIPISITFQQADVREPDKRNASQSKTIRLYGTNSTNLLFENLFDVNIATQTFNPNKKSQCIYFVDEIPQFRGDLQLTKITIEPDTNIVYDCNIVGNEGNVFIDIGEKLLSQLDFSTYDHTYNRANIIDSWDNYVPGTGYYYPFVDNGKNGGSFNNFKVEQFIPCFSAKEYLDKIISDAGYSYTSSFLNGAEFKSNIIYPNISSASLTDAQLLQRQCYVGLNSDVTNIDTSNYVGGSTYDTYKQTLAFNNEANPYFDASPAIHISGITTIPVNGRYDLVFNLKLNLTANNTDPRANKFRHGIVYRLSIEKSTDNGVTWFGLASQLYDLPTGGGYFEDNIPLSKDYNGNVAIVNIPLSSGDKIRCNYAVGLINPIFWDTNTDTDVSGGTYPVDVLSGANGSNFYLLAQTVVQSGATINGNSVLPQNIKQKDLSLIHI